MLLETHSQPPAIICLLVLLSTSTTIAAIGACAALGVGEKVDFLLHAASVFELATSDTTAAAAEGCWLMFEGLQVHACSMQQGLAFVCLLQLTTLLWIRALPACPVGHVPNVVPHQ